MTPREYMIELLKAVEAAIPPPENCHHAIMYAQHGNQVDGYADKLALQVNRGGKFYCFFLEEDDLAYDRANIDCFVSILLQQLTLPDSSFQLAPGSGRFV